MGTSDGDAWMYFLSFFLFGCSLSGIDQLGQKRKELETSES